MRFISVKNITKRYGNVFALENINFEVKEGEIFGIVGPNGAGKSTLIKILTMAIKPDEGEVLIYGSDFKNRKKVVKKLGIVFQETTLDVILTVRENLFFHAILFGFSSSISKNLIKNLASFFNFENYLDMKISELSGGTRRKVEIARALLHSPKVLVMDEPTLGLDIESRNQLWSYIKELNEKNGMTIILTSHYLEEISLCDRVLVLDSGKMRFLGSSKEFIKNFYGKV